jgi:hypothetical protein
LERIKIKKYHLLFLLLIASCTKTSEILIKEDFVKIIEACRELPINKSTYLFSREANAYRLGVILEDYKKSNPEKSTEIAYNVMAVCKEPKKIESYSLKNENGVPVLDAYFDGGKRITF